jgi:hypothetical protein
MLPLLKMAKDDPVAAAECTFFTNADGTAADPGMIRKVAFLDMKSELAAGGCYRDP